MYPIPLRYTLLSYGCGHSTHAHLASDARGFLELVQKEVSGRDIDKGLKCMRVKVRKSKSKGLDYLYRSQQVIYSEKVIVVEGGAGGGQGRMGGCVKRVLVILSHKWICLKLERI